MTGAGAEPGAGVPDEGVCVPDELRGHEPVPTRRSTLRPLGYGAVTAAIALAFLLQILDGVCPVP